MESMTDEQKVILEKFDDCWSEYASLAEEAMFTHKIKRDTVLYSISPFWLSRRAYTIIISIVLSFIVIASTGIVTSTVSPTAPSYAAMSF